MVISRSEHGATAEYAAMPWTPGEEARLLRAARLVVEVHGSNAASYAVTRAALLRDMGDAMGAAAWQRVAPVIEKLQRARKVESPN